jgi:hypothetical protein
VLEKKDQTFGDGPIVFGKPPQTFGFFLGCPLFPGLSPFSVPFSNQSAADTSASTSQLATSHHATNPIKFPNFDGGFREVSSPASCWRVLGQPDFVRQANYYNTNTRLDKCQCFQ